MKRLKWNGVVFWSFSAYALAGAVSGLTLGGEWLRAGNRAGVIHSPMIGVSICLLCAAVIMRTAIIKRGEIDYLASYFSLMAWASLANASVWAGVGWLGRFPGNTALWMLHITLILIGCASGLRAAIETARWAFHSKEPTFKIPGVGLVGGVFSILALSLFDIMFPISSPWLAYAVAVAVSVVAVACLTVRIAFLTPYRKPKGEPCQHPI